MDDDESESAVMKLPKVHSHMQRSAIMIRRQFLFLFSSRFVKTEYSQGFMYSCAIMLWDAYQESRPTKDT